MIVCPGRTLAFAAASAAFTTTKSWLVLSTSVAVLFPGVKSTAPSPGVIVTVFVMLPVAVGYRFATTV